MGQNHAICFQRMSVAWTHQAWILASSAILTILLDFHAARSIADVGREEEAALRDSILTPCRPAQSGLATVQALQGAVRLEDETCER